MGIRSTFMGYETAKSALNYAQKALDITGHNIANGTTTNGYTRQRVESTSAFSLSTNNRIASSNIGLAGQGTSTLGVSQTRDSYLDAAFRKQYAQACYHSEAQGILSDIQQALGTGDDLTNTSEILGSIQGVYEAIYDFTEDCTSESQATIVYNAFQTLTNSLNSAGKKLSEARDDAISNTELVINRVNSILSNIASINDEMSKSAAYSMTRDEAYFYDNELMDQKNLLLDELGGYCDIRVTQYDDGTCDVTVAGYEAVTGKECKTMYLNQNQNGTIDIKWLETGENLKTTTGSLLAGLNYINGRGKNAQDAGETPDEGYLYYQDRLNTLAAAVANVANNAIPQLDKNGDIMKDANGNIVYKKLLGAKQDDGTIASDTTFTAKNITMSQDWQNQGSGYFIYSKDDADYSYALQIATQLTKGDYKFTSFGESFTGTFEEYISDYVLNLADAIDKQGELQTTVSKIADDYQDARDEVMGVQQDEETTNMLSYNRIFQAASRVMSTMDSFLDEIINKMAV